MMLRINIDDDEYKTLCSALNYYSEQAFRATAAMMKKGARDMYGKEYPPTAYKDAFAVFGRSIDIKTRVVRAKQRISWPGTQYSTQGEA